MTTQGKRLKEIRKALNLSQEEFGAKMRLKAIKTIFRKIFCVN